jgi:hypothetical protein
MNDLAKLNESVSALDPADFPRIVEVLDAIAQAKRWLADLQREAEGKAVASLKQSGPVIIGEVKYYAGVEHAVKCRDIRKTAEATMQASGGDWDKFCGCLSAGAFKPGACRVLFTECNDPALFIECFEVVEKGALKEGKPEKTLQKLPLAFVK